MENIDIEKLRKDLIDYFGSAASFYPMAYMNVIEVSKANANRVVEIALNNGFDLNDYKAHTLNK